MRAQLQPQAGFECVGIVVAREAPLTTDRIRVLVVTLQAGRRIHRAADAPKNSVIRRLNFGAQSSKRGAPFGRASSI